MEAPPAIAGRSSKSNTLVVGTPDALTDLMANAFSPVNMKRADCPNPIVVPFTSSIVDTHRTPSISFDCWGCCGIILCAPGNWPYGDHGDIPGGICCWYGLNMNPPIH